MEITFDTRDEARDTLGKMKGIIKMNGKVTVADLVHICDVDMDSDSKNGWLRLSNAVISIDNETKKWNLVLTEPVSVS